MFEVFLAEFLVLKDIHETFGFQEFRLTIRKRKGLWLFCFGFLWKAAISSSKASAQPQIQHSVKKPFHWSSFSECFLLTYSSNRLHTSAEQLLFLFYKHLYFSCQCPQLRLFTFLSRSPLCFLSLLLPFFPACCKSSITSDLLRFGCCLFPCSLQQQLQTAWPPSTFLSVPLLFS